MEIMTKIVASTNVERKIIFSRPLRVNEVWPAPQARLKPFPLAWTRMVATRRMETKICMINSACLITSDYYTSKVSLPNNPVDYRSKKGKYEGKSDKGQDSGEAESRNVKPLSRKSREDKASDGESRYDQSNYIKSYRRRNPPKKAKGEKVDRE